MRGDSRWSGAGGDASARRYFRLAAGGRRWFCMDAPPAREKPRAFCAVAGLLAAGGVRVPEIAAADLARGFILLEDLGDDVLLGRLQDDHAERLYGKAMEVLFRLQGIDAAADAAGAAGPAKPAEPVEIAPEYSEAILREELSRFPQWFCEALLGLRFAASERDAMEKAFDELTAAALEQPRVLVHLDFHSRNLILLPNGELAVIDFQDARRGALCYDLVSLLRDCYIRWPEERVVGWALAYRKRLLDAGRPAGADAAEFMRWFDTAGLQRHIKVLGNFARLAVRDGKPGYLRDIPLVIDYIRAVLRGYAEGGAAEQRGDERREGEACERGRRGTGGRGSGTRGLGRGAAEQRGAALREFLHWFDERVVPEWNKQAPAFGGGDCDNGGARQ